MTTDVHDHAFALPDLFLTPATWVRPPHPIRIEEFAWDHALYLRVEVPTVDVKRDVRVFVHAGNLYVEVDRRPEAELEEEDGFQTEIQRGRFTRVRPLPPGTKVDEIEATYSDGILQIEVPYDHTSVRDIPVTEST